jgi:hypothetical protein
MAKFDFEHGDFSRFKRECKPKKPKREKKPLMYVSPSFNDTLFGIPPKAELPVTPQEDRPDHGGLIHGRLEGNVTHGILNRDGTFTILPKEKRERPLWDF